MDLEIQDAVACITGGAGGIGQAIAGALVKEGAAVVMVDVDAERLEEAAHALDSPRVQAIATDIRAANAARTAIESVLDTHGRIDILVNSAGIVDKCDVFDIDLPRWDLMVETHLTGTFLFSQAAGQAMAGNEGGSIVNIASIAGSLGNPLAVHYSAAKGGVIMLTRSMAVALARHNVRVNAVAPGTVKTAMTESRLSNPELRSKGLDRIPLQRIGSPDDIADAVTFLSSPRASYITGQTVYVDGGWSSQLYGRMYEDMQVEWGLGE